MEWLNFWVPTLQAIGAIGVAGTAIILVYTLYYHKQQIIISNFNSIIEFTGNKETRENRRIVMQGYKMMKKYLDAYPNIKDDQKLKDFHESCKQVCSSYERMGFLLQQNKGLKEKIIKWQGFTTGIMWKLLKPAMKKWEEDDKALPYKSFDFIGDSSYCEYKKEINEWLENRKKMQNDSN